MWPRRCSSLPRPLLRLAAQRRGPWGGARRSVLREREALVCNAARIYRLRECGLGVARRCHVRCSVLRRNGGGRGGGRVGACFVSVKLWSVMLLESIASENVASALLVAATSVAPSCGATVVTVGAVA